MKRMLDEVRVFSTASVGFATFYYPVGWVWDLVSRRAPSPLLLSPPMRPQGARRCCGGIWRRQRGGSRDESREEVEKVESGGQASRRRAGEAREKP